MSTATATQSAPVPAAFVRHHTRKRIAVDSVNAILKFEDLTIRNAINNLIDVEISGSVEVIIGLDKNDSFIEIQGIGDFTLTSMWNSDDGFTVVKPMADSIMASLTGPVVANHSKLKALAIEWIDERYDADVEYCGMRDEWKF